MVDDHRDNIEHGRGELLGLPGVGKSWVSRNGSSVFPLNAKLLLVPQGWTIDKLAHVIAGLWVGRALLPVILQFLSANIDRAWRRHIRSALLIFERLGRQARNTDHARQVINDEGVLQALWSLAVNTGMKSERPELFDELFRRAATFVGSVYYVSGPRNMRVGRQGASSDTVANREPRRERECMGFILRRARSLGIRISMVRNFGYLKRGTEMRRPFVSVVIPMRNEAAYIGGCLQSLLENDYPDDLLEILVVDGMSNDASRDIVTEFASANATIRSLSNPERTTPTALNVGIDEAKGDVIVRMDVHAIYPRDYISRCVGALLIHGADNVGGVWDIQPGAETSVARAIALAQSHPVGVGNAAYRIGSKEIRWVDTVPYGCYRKDVLERLGGFDPELIRNQDDELNARLRMVGGKILLDPSIQCTYFARATLEQTARMFFQYGYFKPLAARKIGRAYTVRQLVPPAFVGSVVLLSVGSMISNIVLWILVTLLSVYAIVITSAAVSAGKNAGAWVVLWLPAVFATMHLSYGLGSLRGVIDFLVRRRQPRDVPLTR